MKKKSVLVKITIILCTIIAAFGIIILGVRAYFRLPVKSYYEASEKTFVIPEFNRGFIAQGIDYDQDNELFLCTGYMKSSDAASPLYIIDGTTNSLKKTLSLQRENGEAYTGHSGGLAVARGKVYVADGTGLLVYDYDEMLKAKDKSTVKAISRFSAELSKDDYIGVAFVSPMPDGILVGEFYRSGNYETLSSHEIRLDDGTTNRAVAVKFDFDDSVNGISASPSVAYSLPGLVQGMCFDDGKIYLSTSWGPSFSHIYVYDEPQDAVRPDYKILGTEIPLYALSSDKLVSDRKIAPMSEEIVSVNGKLYVMCESASNKYIFGKFTSAKWCYATDIQWLLENK